MFSKVTWFSEKLLAFLQRAELKSSIHFLILQHLFFQDFPICQFTGFYLSPFPQKTVCSLTVAFYVKSKVGLINEYSDWPQVFLLAW